MSANFDVIVAGGTVIDGTKRPRFRADVGIRGGIIAAVGNLQAAQAGRRMEATGKIVSPGFIDVHTHSDGWLIAEPRLGCKLSQGFTTEFLGLDGIGYAPVNRHTWRQWLHYLRGLDALRLNDYRGWESLADYAAALGSPSQNFVLHVPYANVRSMYCGWGRAAPDDFQMRSMQLEIQRGMEEGAIGLSTGLDYVSQNFSRTDELVAACEAIRPYGGTYVTHVRYKLGLIPAVKEAVEIGRRAGVKVHISHLKAPTPAETERLLEYIDKEARHACDFSFDVYPYTRASTMLNYLLPYEVWEDGPLAAAARLSRPELMTRFRHSLTDAYRLSPENLILAWVGSADGRPAPRPDEWKERAQAKSAGALWLGRTLAEYAEAMGFPPEEALIHLLIEENMAVLLVLAEGNDAVVRPMLQHDLFMLGSDGIYHPSGRVHPRLTGSAPRVIGRAVREWKLFSLEEAVYKLTSYPAQRFGLADRGVIREGAAADLVVFDADTIIDNATYEDPHALTTGVEHVLVNGAEVWPEATASTGRQLRPTL
jgi:N-acyl-D-amino-acid deacylase